MTFVVREKYILLPYILAACFVPTDQRIIIMGLDFTILRILTLVGLLRIWIYGEQIPLKWNTLDKILLAWAICGSLVYIIQWMNMKAVINRCGYLFDTLGLYYLFRQKLRSWDQVRFSGCLLAVSALLLAPLVALEWTTGSNPFVILGRVVTSVREGRYRCQTAFPHAIMLGLFWATLVPLFAGLAKTERLKQMYWAAIGASIFIVLSTASSTPLAVLLLVMCIMGLFRYRRYARQAAYCLCVFGVGLHIIMQAPVWHLISRIDLIGGSTGWHRYNLINQAVRHFGEWMLIGCRDTGHWGFGLADVTNQYVLEGVRGGFVTLLLFVLLLITALKAIVRYSLQTTSAAQQWFTWCICVSLLGHCLSFIGVSYFGQIRMLFFLVLAAAALTYEMSTNQFPNYNAADTAANKNKALYCYG